MQTENPNISIVNDNLDKLSLDDTDIIETLRFDEVIELVEKFVKDNNLVPHCINIGLKYLYTKSCTVYPLYPDQILFDKKFVMNTIQNFDVSTLPFFFHQPVNKSTPNKSEANTKQTANNKSREKTRKTATKHKKSTN